jgi:hypothetical protein
MLLGIPNTDGGIRMEVIWKVQEDEKRHMTRFRTCPHISLHQSWSRHLRLFLIPLGIGFTLHFTGLFLDSEPLYIAFCAAERRPL